MHPSKRNRARPSLEPLENLIVPAGGWLTEQFPNQAYPWNGLQWSGQNVIQQVYTAPPPDNRQCATSMYELTEIGTPTEDDYSAMAQDYPGWLLVALDNAPGANSLSANSLVVQTYQAVGSPGLVQGIIQIKYAPHAGDPGTPAGPEGAMHWIQIVTTNDFSPDTYGTTFTFVDSAPQGQPQGPTPYYDTNGGAANGTGFGDAPERPQPPIRDITWSADLFLVTEISAEAHLLQIWGGVHWGWSNQIGGGNSPVRVPESLAAQYTNAIGHGGAEQITPAAAAMAEPSVLVNGSLSNWSEPLDGVPSTGAQEAVELQPPASVPGSDGSLKVATLPRGDGSAGPQDGADHVLDAVFETEFRPWPALDSSSTL